MVNRQARQKTGLENKRVTDRKMWMKCVIYLVVIL